MDKRTILAFALIGLITLAWMWTMQATQKRRAEQAKGAQRETPTTTEAPAAQKPPVESPVEKPAVTTPAPAVAPAQAVSERNDIRMAGSDLKQETVWTNRGGALREARLADYKEVKDKPEGVLLLASAGENLNTFGLQDPAGLLPLDSQNYEVVVDEPGRKVFALTLKNGLRVVKEFVARPGKPEIGLKITLENQGAEPFKSQYRILAASRVMPEAVSDPELHGLIGARYPNGRTEITDKPPGKLKPNEPFIRNNSDNMPIIWAGGGNRYFAAVLRPVLGENKTTFGWITSANVEFLSQSEVTQSQWGRAGKADNVLVSLTTNVRIIEPGKAITDEYTYFLGPRKQEVLAPYPDMGVLLDYGFFGFVSRFLLGLLHVFHFVIPNYGVGIILMTILVKVCLFPMTRKSQISMHKMQRLHPQIKELQEKHKDDRQRQGKEMMELYKRHGANPMSGCWPIMLQLPIFWGLFQMLRYSVDLRHEGFALWISDLSKPDTITEIGGLPINILPVLMVISWFFQQWTMPKPADPQQAQTQKMMMFMPVIFGFMLYGMAAGLTLYWLTSTFLGIVEQRLIKMQIAHMEATGVFVVAQTDDKPNRGKSKRK